MKEMIERSKILNIKIEVKKERGLGNEKGEKLFKR